MTLQQVNVRNRQGETLSFPLDSADSGFIVADIQGLGPVKATMSSSSFAGQDGEYFHSARRESRNIVMQIELDPPVGTSVRQARKILYNYFMTKVQVFLTFILDDLEVNIEGRVESCEPSMFTAEPAMDISIICHQPDFIEPEAVVETGMSTDDVTARVIEYAGDVEAGVEIVVEVQRPTLDSLTVYHQTPTGDVRTLEFAAPLVENDVLTINTNRGAKGASLLRDGSTSSVLYGVSPPSNWIELSRGTNELRVYAEGTGVPVTVTYTPRYGGL